MKHNRPGVSQVRCSLRAVFVAYALVRAASALMPTLVYETVNAPQAGVETSLDAARTSAYATKTLM
jgi:hypothetical protein